VLGARQESAVPDVATPSRSSLWRNADFLKLWASQTVSQLGNEVTSFALPLVAVLTLHAGPSELGLIFVAFSVPSIAIGLFAGVWVDRLQRRPLLIVTDLASAAIIASIPIGAAAGFLSMTQLYVVAVLFGLLEPFFWTSFSAYVPTLVERERLVEANGKLSASEAGIGILGPAVGGGLVQVLSAPFAMIADAGSFVASAICLAGVRTRETPSTSPDGERRMMSEIREGARVIRSNEVQASIVTVELLRVVSSLVWPNYVLFAIEVLGMSPAAFGVVGAVGAVGFLVGSLLGPRVTHRFGIGRTLMTGSLLILASPFLMPFAPSGSPLAVWLLIGAAIVGATGDVAISVTLRSYRQAITPQRLLGRVTATSYVLTGVALAIGPIVGGYLGETIGIRRTILLAACLHIVYPIVMWWSPLRSLESMPAASADTVSSEHE
jgi:MFS family permease